ncbi:MAG: hypothetical protein IKO59_02960, partial [Bacteroidales bacterium]|nr:hypothetical protein [Bacteroidales bacterium]
NCTIHTNNDFNYKTQKYKKNGYEKRCGKKICRDVILWRPYTITPRRYQWNHGVPIPWRTADTNGTMASLYHYVTPLPMETSFFFRAPQ